LKKAFVENVLPSLVEKTMVTYVQPALVNCLLATCTLDLLKGMHYIFVVVVNFIFNSWEAKHVIVGLFEVINTNGMAMAPKLQELLDRFVLIDKIVAYVKDERSNL
jgi:hypothetical protein